MRLPSSAVGRPVATAMVFVALTVVGAFSYLQLKVDVFPDIDFPSISVVTTYSGVSPEEMETLVTRPIESAVARVEGIEEIESSSSEGRSRVALRFEWGVDLDTAVSDVRAAVERIRPMLPEEADAPVVYKFDLTSLPVMYVALSGARDEGGLRRFSEEVVQPRLERVLGVASVDVRGGRDRQIWVELDVERLAALRIDPLQVVRSLQSQSLTVPAGQVEYGRENVLVRAMGEFESVQQIAQAVVAWRDGQPIRVADVAVVVDGMEERVNIARINGVEGIQLTVSKSPNANTVEVADNLYRAVERFNQDYAGEAELRIMVDTSQFIRRSISGVQRAVLIGAALALFVLLFFLQSVRSTLVIGVAIPIAIIGTFLPMHQLGLTLNLISFGGLALGVGMLVDNAIVILENIYRHREAGVGAREAAIVGSDEVGTAITASTMTTLTVFLPVLFLGGFTAVFFQQMALVVTSALLCSLFVALTLVPVLASVLLRRVKPLGERRNPLRRLLDALDRVYARLVSGALRWSPLVVLLAVGLLVGSFSFIDRVGTEMLPESDESEVRIDADYPVGTRIEVTEETVERIEAIVREHVPEATDIMSYVGSRGSWSSRGEESARLRVNLLPVEQRDRSSEEIANALRPVLAGEIPGMRLVTRVGGGLWIFNFIRGGEDRIRIEIRGHDLATADRLAQEVAELVEAVDGTADVRPGRINGGRELRLYVDRQRAADFGLLTRDVAEVISLLVQGRRATVYRERGDEFEIRVQLGADDRRSLESLLRTPVTLPEGQVVALGELVQIDRGETPQEIERLEQQRIVVVSGVLTEGYNLGHVNAAVSERLAQLDVPEGFSVLMGGEAAEQEQTFESMAFGLLLAVLLVYMVMAGQFESFSQPLVIMVSVPFALTGVIATLLVTGTTMNINSGMGVIVLVGVVVNNAIVLLDYINLLRRKHGMALRDAVVEGARRRLRPILMTTLTTSLALLPVAIGTGTGGESQAPLARVVIGGLLVSMVITLFLVPILYSWSEGLKQRLALARRSRDGAD